MKIHQQLTISGSREAVADFVDRLAPPEGSGWFRKTESEKKVSHMFLSEDKSYCFSAPQRGKRPRADLWLAFRHGRQDEMYIPNILPCEGTGLSHDDYNGVLLEFAGSIATPAADAAGTSLKLTNATFQIDDFSSPNTASLLKTFSSLANRSTGSSHPFDQQRWFDFVIAAHQESAPLDFHLLGRWLCEVAGWSDEHANELAIEYENARALLKQYDGGPPEAE